MKSFYHYLAESTKDYRYRVKSVVPMDEQFVETLKRALFRYDIKSVSQPKKTPVQKNPLDFREYDNAEVWILDVVTTIPAVSYVLATELRQALKVSDRTIIVRGENEPVALEAEKIEEIHKDDQQAKLLDGAYEQEEQPKEVAYGDTYNKKLLDYLSQVRANNQDPEVPAIEAVKKTAKFSWLNKKDTSVAPDFNEGLDTVKPVHVNDKKKSKDITKPNLTGNHGNYDENVKRKG